MPKVVKRSRGWCFTINNYSAADIEAVNAVQTRYTCYGLEEGKCGTPHIQGYLYFQSGVTFSRVKKFIPTAHLEAAKGSPAQNRTYCSKEGEFTEHGEIPQKGKRSDLSNFVLDVEKADGRISEDSLLKEYTAVVARYPNFVDWVIRHFHPPVPLTKLTNYWYYGPPGTGKTTAAGKLGPKYVKGPNKWFCGYTDQKVLVLEDFGPEHSFMSHSLKIWADKDPFTAQTKGSSMFIRPQIVCVTSNYSIDEMGWDEVTTAAIKRRFSQKLFSEVYPQDDPQDLVIV